MKKITIGLLTLAFVQIASAWNVGLFASHWSHKDGDAVWGAGVLLLPEIVPVEVRGTFYERSDTGTLQASPIDVGLALNLTRFERGRISAVGGASYYWMDAKGSSPDNEFGWYAGGRIEFAPHQQYGLFGEALYRGAKLDDADFSGVTFNLGILF